MARRKPPREKLLEMARERGVLSVREVEAQGIHSQLLTRLVAEGVIERVARGRYQLANRKQMNHSSLVLVAASVPRGVVCLLSALDFHGVGTQVPGKVWIALDRRVRRPALKWPPLQVVRFSGKALTEGVETHVFDGHPVRVYGVAKTIADCFKYRNKIGIDIAMEALREGWAERRFTMDEISRYARICRVHRVIRPYLELLVA